MAAIEMRVDLSTLVDAIVSGDESRIIATARAHLQQGDAADVLIGRIGMIAAHGDPEGHIITSLDAAAMLCRYMRFIPNPGDPESSAVATEMALPLFAQALLIAAPAVRAGFRATENYPDPMFPSDLLASDQNVGEVMKKAVMSNDALTAERLLLGLYGTGADYRSMEVQTYFGIASTFQNGGHPFIFAARGLQLLEAVEWGDRAPHIINWLAPHLPLAPSSDEPEWIKTVRTYVDNPQNSVAGLRTRLAAPKEEGALALRKLILSDADTAQICQRVYDALMKEGSSPKGVASAIVLAATEIVLRTDVSDSVAFIDAAHGLLFAASVSLAVRQVQDVEILPILFTAAAYVNTLQKEVPSAGKASSASASSKAAGGLLGASQLEALNTQLVQLDYVGALNTTRRYLGLKHDARPLFSTIALAAVENAPENDGHLLQIIQAASEEFLALPRNLPGADGDILLQVALRAAVIGKNGN